MTDRRVRICDIAEELGLSTATVSNVIHGKREKVSEETAKRVQALLEEREYIPNMAGILLAQNDSGIIGVVINRHEKYEEHPLEDAFIASSLDHLSTEIEGRNMFMMVKTTTRVEEILRFSSMWNMEGLVLIGFCGADYSWLRERMRIPFVIYDGYLSKTERIFNLTIDDYDGGVQVGRLFREQGRKRVLYLADNDICMDLARWEGFRDGFGGEGADFLVIPMAREERIPFYRREMETLKTHDAAFLASDYYALEFMRVLQEQGIRVPEDMAVAGFDDTPVCTQVYPTLTSVRQDGALRAKMAMEQLFGLKSGEETGQTLRLPVTLIQRESTSIK